MYKRQSFFKKYIDIRSYCDIIKIQRNKEKTSTNRKGDVMEKSFDNILLEGYVIFYMLLGYEFIIENGHTVAMKKRK